MTAFPVLTARTQLTIALKNRDAQAEVKHLVNNIASQHLVAANKTGDGIGSSWLLIYELTGTLVQVSKTCQSLLEKLSKNTNLLRLTVSSHDSEWYKPQSNSR